MIAVRTEGLLALITLCHRFTVFAMCPFAVVTMIDSHATGAERLVARFAAHFRTAVNARWRMATVAAPHLFAVGTVRHITLQGIKGENEK